MNWWAPILGRAGTLSRRKDAVYPSVIRCSNRRARAQTCPRLPNPLTILIGCNHCDDGHRLICLPSVYWFSVRWSIGCVQLAVWCGFANTIFSEYGSFALFKFTKSGQLLPQFRRLYNIYCDDIYWQFYTSPTSLQVDAKELR
jgi:hypothetical protein